MTAYLIVPIDNGSGTPECPATGTSGKRTSVYDNGTPSGSGETWSLVPDPGPAPPGGWDITGTISFGVSPCINSISLSFLWDRDPPGSPNNYTQVLLNGTPISGYYNVVNGVVSGGGTNLEPDGSGSNKNVTADIDFTEGPCNVITILGRAVSNEGSNSKIEASGATFVLSWV